MTHMTSPSATFPLSLLLNAFLVAVCVSGFAAPPKPFGESAPEAMSAVEALDYKLARELTSLLNDNNRQEFLALLTFVSTKQPTRKAYIEVMFRAAAHPDSLFLLALLKSGVVSVNDETEDGFSLGSSALEVPEKDDFPHRLRRLQLLFDVGYKSRTGELLVQAAVKNCPEVINELDERLGDKMDVNAQFSGTTPLIAAVKHGSAQCVSMLLARQADPRVRDSDGKSASDYAAQDLPATNKDEALRSRMLTIRRLIQDATKEKSSAPK